MSAETDHRVASYIADSWRDGSTDDVIEVVNPATAEVIGSFTAASAADVDQAVTAARAAFAVWSKTLPGQPIPYSAIEVPALAVPGAVVMVDLWVYVGSA